MKNNDQKRLRVTAVMLVVGSALLIGSQFLFSRDIRYDQQTARDLERIESALSESTDSIDSIEDLNLPSDIEQRAEERNYSVSFVRKESSRASVYEICAEFMQNTEEKQEDYQYYQPYSEHSSGTDCFEREVYIRNLPSPVR